MAGATAAVVSRGARAERTLMRVHLGEADRHQGAPAYEAIVRLLRERGLAGATVMRGVGGFGASRAVRSMVSEVGALDLPVVVECVDTEARIRDVLPGVGAMVAGGVITLERAEVIVYRPDPARDAGMGRDA
jgi:PII-like signaling protein